MKHNYVNWEKYTNKEDVGYAQKTKQKNINFQIGVNVMWNRVSFKFM